MDDISINLGRYVEKSTGNLWKCYGFCTKSDTRYYHMRIYDEINANGGKSEKFEFTANEIKERFEEKPFNKPLIKTFDVEKRHPIRITLYCPECGSELKTDGGAYLTYPLQYEHKCSNPDCTYETCISSYYSGMFAAVTDEQEEKIKNGTYKETIDGEIIRLEEKDLWEFKR